MCLLACRSHKVKGSQVCVLLRTAQALFAPCLWSPRLTTERDHILTQQPHARVAPGRSPSPALREIGKGTVEWAAGISGWSGYGGEVTVWDSHDLSWACRTNRRSSTAAGKVIS